MECEYGNNISLAIQRTDQACNDLQKALEEAKKHDDDPDAVEVLRDTKKCHQQPIIDLIKLKKQHQATCSACSSA